MGGGVGPDCTSPVILTITKGVQCLSESKGRACAGVPRCEAVHRNYPGDTHRALPLAQPASWSSPTCGKQCPEQVEGNIYGIRKLVGPRLGGVPSGWHPLFVLKANQSINELFGFTTYLRSHTGNQASPSAYATTGRAGRPLRHNQPPTIQSGSIDA